MEISIKWNVCRVCLREETQNREDVSGSCNSSSVNLNPMRNIFKDKKLVKQIYDCSGVLMKQNDSLPDKICKQCLTVLRHAVHFRSTCRNSDEYLQSVMQKTRSATSLFQLDKRREKSLELVDEVIEDLFEDDDEKSNCVLIENEREDIVTEKRKREPTRSSTLEQLNETKKSKVDTNTIKTEDHEDQLSLSCSKLLSSEDNSEIDLLKELDDSGDVLENETTVTASDSADLVLDESSPTEIPLKSPLCAFRSVNSTASDNELKMSSVDSVAGTYILDYEQDSPAIEKSEEDDDAVEIEANEEVIEDADAEDEMNERVENEKQETIYTDAKTQLEELQDILHNVKPLIVDTILDVSEESDFQSEVDIESKAEEFFYIVEQVAETDIKREKDDLEDDIDEIDNIEFVNIDDESKSEFNSHGMENVEYLMDGTDDQSQPELETKTSILNATTLVGNSKQQSLQKRKVGTESQVFVCDVCGNSFTNKSLLNFHMKIHRNEKNYECELCFKRFNAACNLTAHMRIHTGEKPFECQFCGRRFSDRSSHLKHERIHTNEKPYKCNTCAKAFSLSTSLKAHEKIHTGEKPYKCQPCLKSFKLPHQLKAHLNTHLHKLLSIEQ